MRILFALMFLVGIGIAGTAVFLAKEQFTDLQTKNADLARRAANIVDSITVVVAKKDLPYGIKITEDDVQEVLFPKNAIPESSFLSIEDLLGGVGAAPRTVLRSMVKDEVIMDSKVTDFGKDAGITSKLEPGMSAFTIKVDAGTGVAGFLKPGAFVDIYWTGRTGNGSRTRRLFSSIELIAIDQNFDEDTTGTRLARTVTAQVTPQVAADLGQAQSSGKLSLSLRGAVPDGVEVSDDESIESTQQTLLGVEVEAEQCFRTVRRGNEVTRTQYACTEQSSTNFPAIIDGQEAELDEEQEIEPQ